MGDNLPTQPWDGHRERIEALEEKLAYADEQLTRLVQCLMAEPALHINYAKVFLTDADDRKSGP